MIKKISQKAAELVRGRKAAKSETMPVSMVEKTPAKQASKAKAPKVDAKVEYRRAYDRLRYAKAHGKISAAKMERELKSLKLQYGIGA